MTTGVEQAHVLGSQIPMAFDDPAFTDPSIEYFGSTFQVVEKQRRHSFDALPRYRRELFELLNRILNVLHETAAILRRVDFHGGRSLVENRQCLGKPANAAPLDFPALDGSIEHSPRGQASHLDQPVHHLRFASEHQRSRLVHSQRHDTDIDVGSKTGIQAHLGMTVPPTILEGGEVQQFETHGFLQLVDVTLDEKHPGHMGFDHIDAGRPFRITSGTPEKAHFFFERRSRILIPFHRSDLA